MSMRSQLSSHGLMKSIARPRLVRCCVSKGSRPLLSLCVAEGDWFEDMRSV